MTERDIFIAALQKENAAERDAYLGEACAGQSALRGQVEALLRLHQQAGGFLEQPAGGQAGTSAFALGPGMNVTQDKPAEGAVIGPYKLIQEIGEGGMGSVYMAQQTEPVKRLVALKLIKPGMDSKQVIARFEAERQSLALMDHPNIAKVLDAGTTGSEAEAQRGATHDSPRWASASSGRPYFVMELVKGVPITKYCDEHRLNPKQRLELFIPVCQAIQHAHQKGIIHRDIKPSNVLVASYDGKPVPKVIDFGIAKAAGQQLTERTLVTGFGAMVGTLEYMSPEQAEMNQLDIDTRSDIYSLGVLLYELLTGTTPLEKKKLKDAAMLELLRLIREEEPPRPSTRLSTTEQLPSIAASRGLEPKKLSGLVRGELDWIVMKALEKDRSRRYETANGLAMDVLRYLADEPVQACPPSASYRLRKLVRRNKAIIATTAVVAIALILGIVISSWQAIRATNAEHLSDRRLLSEREARNQAEKAEAEKTDRLWDSLLARAEANRYSGQPGRRFKGLEAVRQATAIKTDLRLRNEAIALLTLPDVRVAKELPQGHPTGTQANTFDPDFQHYARSDLKGTISIRRVADDEQVSLLPGPGTHAYHLKFSPDGRFLSAWYSDPSSGRIWDWRSAKVILEEPSDAFSPDGASVARMQPDGWLALYELPSGQVVKRIQIGPPSQQALLYPIQFHPDGKLLAIATREPDELKLIDLEAGKVIRTVSWEKGGNLAWQTGDTRLLQFTRDQRVLWDTRTWTQQISLHAPDSDTTNACFSPRDDLLASSGWDGRLRLWNPTTGRELFALPGSGVPQFSRDGSRMGPTTLGTTVQIWEVVGSRGYRILRTPCEGRITWKIDFSPDGALLAATGAGGARLWDVAAGRDVADLPTGACSGLVFAADGSALLTRTAAGLEHWPIRANATGIAIGPRQHLTPLEWVAESGTLAAAGDKLAANLRGEGVVLLLDPQEPAKAVKLPEHTASSGELSVSPDGHWVAARTWWELPDKLRVSDVRTRKVVWTYRENTPGTFSPDSRWLVTGGDACRIWKTGAWESEPPRIIESPGGLGRVNCTAFAPDGIVLAIAYEAGPVRLVDARTGQELATLPLPDGYGTGRMCFSPDGSRLACVMPNLGVLLWDLRDIRVQLKVMGLDWNLPDYPPKPAAAAPITVRVVPEAVQKK